jgi:hypothetical protein
MCDAVSFEVLVRAAGTSQKYRDACGLEYLAKKFKKALRDETEREAVEIILGIQPDPSKWTDDARLLAIDAMGARSKPKTAFSATR